MLKNKFSLIIATVFAVALSGCGGSGGDAAPVVQFTSQVNFGDSLSDVGTYAVGEVATLGGGRYTVNAFMPNGAPVPSNWSELVANVLGVPAPCPAETGLKGDPGQGYNIPTVPHPGCTSYAQGGARVTNPLGPGNASLGIGLGGNPILGALTVPVGCIGCANETQISNYLNSHGGKFSGTEIVFVLAGANDAIVSALTYIGASKIVGPDGAKAAALQTMSVAATDLTGYVNNLMLGNGAQYVVVLNLPPLDLTPLAAGLELQFPGIGVRAVMNALVSEFNSLLAKNLTSPKVLLADLNTATVLQINNPQNFGVTNVTTPACQPNLPNLPNLPSPPFPPNLPNPLTGSALVCNASTVIGGDVSRYAFADSVHPTPWGNTLIASFVAQQLIARGWAQ